MKRSRRYVAVFLMMMASLLFLSGCWDANDIEKRSAVAMMGVDRAKNGELIVSAQLPVPLDISGGGGEDSGGGDSSVKVVSAKGQTFQQALQRIQNGVNGKLYLGHTDIIAFSEDVAKHDLRAIFDPLRRMEPLRRGLYPVVVQDGDAKDLLKVQTRLEKLPAMFINNSIHNEVRLGELPNATLGEFYINHSNTATQPSMMTLRVAKKKYINVTGLAVFRGTKLKGYLDRGETAQFMQIAKHKGGGDMTIQVPDASEKVTIDPSVKNVKYRFSFKNGKVHADIRAYLEGSLEEMTQQINLSDKQKRKRLQRGIARGLEKRSGSLVHKLQEDDGSDVLNLGAHLRAFHQDMWSKVDWKKAFPKADINIHYKVRIRRGGMRHD